MADVQQRTRHLRRTRALISAAAVLELGNFAWHLVAGPNAATPLLGFAGLMFALLAVIQTVTIRRMRAEARRVVTPPPAGGFVIEGPAEFIALQTGMISMAEFRERMAAFSPWPPVAMPTPRSAWDVSMQLDRDTPWNDVCHYEDVSRKPGAGTEGIVRVIPRGRRPRGLHAVTSWTVVTRAPSHGEGIDLLKVAEPLLRERMAELADASQRYFRVEDGRLVGGTVGCALRKAEDAPGPCAHVNAEPVDLLVTGDRVAWVCPDCPAELPADWR